MVSRAGHLALEMLMGDSRMLDVAREVSDAIKAANLEGGIVGGIAVFLHGYERTTTDIDVYVTDRQALAGELADRGFVWSENDKQFEKNEVPVQVLESEDNLPFLPTRFSEIDGLRTITLGDLITMKLSTGTKFVHRAQDLADVVRLIQAVPLDKSFVGRVAKPYRDEFKKLIDQLDGESSDRFSPR
ncbi:MAG: hypothetical protein AAF797_13315 [Planctomycetota bacterium]